MVIMDKRILWNLILRPTGDDANSVSYFIERYLPEKTVSMVVADDLVPIWRQGICNHHDGIGRSVHVRGVPV